MVNSIDLLKEVVGATVVKYTNYAVVVGKTLYVNLSHAGLVPELNKNKQAIIDGMNEVLEQEMIRKAVIMGPEELYPKLPI
jgi:hypothetical protein